MTPPNAAETERLALIIEEAGEFARELMFGAPDSLEAEALDVLMAIALMNAADDLDGHFGKSFGAPDPEIGPSAIISLCLDASKDACKTLRHGHESRWPAGGLSNRSRLSSTLHDLRRAIEAFRGEAPSETELRERFDRKRRYFHHQEGVRL